MKLTTKLTIRAATAASLALAVLVPVGAASAGSASSVSRRSCPLPKFGPGAAYHPIIDRASFTPNVDNTFFPLVPGRIAVYSGTKDDKQALNIFAPSAKTKVIDGVTTRVVEDRLYLDNQLEETTADYYAQDQCGNVWYFGEDTATLDEHGQVVSREGSFHAGVDGAEPGVFMQARPRLGRQFRQEWYSGHAEDRFKVIDRSTQIEVPAGRFRHALRTAEATDLEPGVLDNKVFARGIGEVLEQAVKGPVEKLELIELINLHTATSLDEVAPATATAVVAMSAIHKAGVAEHVQ
jgi:hypothetical protein